VPPAPRAKLAPLSPGRFAWQVTVDHETQDQLRYAQALLGHAIPNGDIAAVLKRALDSLVEKLERKKFAKRVRSRPRRSSANGRYVPAAIRSKVWQRDGGQCTFTSEQGKRCEERTRLEFDHMDPVARGGQTTADRMRLLCRAHNQYDAECTYGAGFMDEKRQARRGTPHTEFQAYAHAPEQVQAPAHSRVRVRTHAQPPEQPSATAARSSAS
jgi:5-methylcytosine-specific restriction endonuclease McrA